MNSQNKLSLEALEHPPGTNTQYFPTEHPAAVEQARLPAEEAETWRAHRPSLLECFYHWLMSRS